MNITVINTNGLRTNNGKRSEAETVFLLINSSAISVI